MSVEEEVMRIQKKLNKMSSGDGTVGFSNFLCYYEGGMTFRLI
jgi:hypothetical protein